MGFEAAPPNDFRASLRPGARRASPLVTQKRRSETSGSLDAVKVSRSETRRANQRNGDRHRLSDEQAVVRRKGKTHVVELINLSQGGAMVAGTFKAKLWDKVALVLGEAGEIECAVRWIRDDRIGLEFAHETKIECDSKTLNALLRQVIRNSFPEVEIGGLPAKSENAEEKRLLVRHPLIWSGILHHDYEWEVVRLRNVSSGGALVECPVSLPSGVTVYLELDNIGKLGATVSWSRGNQTGLAFDEPFDVSALSKSTPEIASEDAARSHPAPYGRECDQSPWAPQWERLSVKQLGAKLGG